ncbi:MAG: GWxTD domain-containing protein [Candidatus Marinimicrobia bacterium]|nr:GWxTD domain-containing protein [Candidatus Neomarinimicrobiota bacterium]
MNKIIRFCLLGALIFAAAPTSLDGQERGRRNRGTGVFERKERNSPFKLVLSQLPGVTEDSAVVHIYTQIPLSRLVFIHVDDAFEANYEISIFFLNKDEKVAGTVIWNEKVVKSSFSDTRDSDALDHAHATINVPAGTYNITAHMTDLDSRERVTAREKMEVETYDPDSLLLGQMMLLAEEQFDLADLSTLLPVADGTVSNMADSFYVLLTIRSPAEEPLQARLSYEMTSDKDSVLTGSADLELQPGLNFHVIPFATEDLVDRKYTLEAQLESGGLSVEGSLALSVKWAGFSTHIMDIESAVEQARYVANRKQMKAMRELKGDMKREAFLEFWKSLDPTPGTPHNELMDEYYGRVAFSNKNYETYENGWRSDRGKVYIIYGPPDEIISNPSFGNRRPTTVWHYYTKKWRFVFVDVNMFGDYQLVTPLYPIGGG